MMKTVKMCDMNSWIAAKVFQMLNPDQITLMVNNYNEEAIVTDVEPKDLIYPEGWYYAKGCFRNKHMSTTGIYGEIEMETSDGTSWREIAKYCTLR